MESFSAFAKGEYVYLSCGDSSATDLSDSSVDAILTDPPFLITFIVLSLLTYLMFRSIISLE